MSVVIANTPTTSLETHGSSIHDILARIQHDPLEQEAIARAHRAIVDGTTDPTFRENILQEITQLSQTVLQIEQHFSEISDSLRHIDFKQILRNENGSPMRFLPEWNSYHELYCSLLQASQTTATQLKTKIDDLLINLIPLINDREVTLDDKKEELAGYIEDLDEFQTRGAGKAQEFQQLRENVKNFGKNLTKEVGDQKSGVVKDLLTISGRISQLESELRASEGFFAACWSVLNTPTILGAVSISAGVAGFAGLIALAPMTSGLLVAGGLASLGFGISKELRERDKIHREKKTTIRDLKSQRVPLYGRRTSLDEVGAEVVRLASDFDDIFNKLGAMQQIWTMIKSDAVGLQEAMSQMRNARTTAGFNARIRNVEKLWYTLAWALDNYALRVSTTSD